MSDGFRLNDAASKLDFRASLPGASVWDRCAHSLRTLQSEGAAGIDLLPLALSASWLVNSKATSRTFQRWMIHDGWARLLDALPFAGGWADARRDDAQAAVRDLAAVEGASLAAITKVLALLRPHIVCLMDDAAIAFALGAVPMPEQENTCSADPALFTPMMDWFHAQVETLEPALVQLAIGHRFAVLDAPQVLDRLLWVDSYGKRYLAR